MSQVVVVTGGAGGIGSAICRALGEDGHNVVVADFNEPAAQKLAGDIGKNGGQALAVGVDVGDKASVDGMIAAAIEKFGHIDVQLNAAGVIKRCPVLEMPADEWERVIRVNLTGIFLCSQAAAIHMAERKAGRIINVASGRGVTGQALGSHYAASKGGVITFTKTLAIELAPYNVTANAIGPGATETDMARAGMSEEQWSRKQTASPLLGGFTQKDEITGLIRYLISDAARYISGQLFLLRTA
jgi:NAD(P)-dependent dehydrogenase (short-subunit alcohol dehydrogenase family)